MISTRLAAESDIDVICSFDHIGQEDREWREFIARSVKAACCYVAVIDDHVAAYAVPAYAVALKGFIATMYVHPSYRQRGVGVALIRYLDSVCSPPNPKSLTWLDLSGVPIQSLLAQYGYVLNGAIDEDDPEAIYFWHSQKP